MPGSGRVVMTWPSGGHNAGCLCFGPDGFLYIATGDGSGPNPPDGLTTGQDVSDLLGSILRIDVDNAAAGRDYAVPADNPFVGLDGARAEIWAYGLRNPFKISIDRETGDLWIGDVGAGRWEEIDFAPYGGDAPLNFGWPECEGTHEVGSSTSCSFDHDGPVVEIPRPSGGGAITGGYVYRGSEIPDLYGHYVFGELTSRNVYAWDRSTVDSGTGLGVIEILDNYERQFATFGETEDGELLIRQGDKVAAEASLRRAWELAPETGRFAYVLSVALQDAGQVQEASAVLAQAYRRRPADVNLLFALVQALHGAGDLVTARSYAAELAKRLPGDPRVRQLQAALGQ